MIGKGGICAVALVALSAAATGCTMQQKSQPQQETAPPPRQAIATPSDLQTPVHDAELWGKALYDSYVAPTAANDKSVARAIETVHQAVKDHCSGTYRAVAVMAPGAPKDRIVIYEIGEAPPAEGIMVGRHYRVETTLDGRGVLLGEPSTTGCVILPPAAASAATPSIVQHDLSPAPNEYHVFLSLIYGRRFEMVSQSGHWLVEHGKITYLGRT